MCKHMIDELREIMPDDEKLKEILAVVTLHYAHEIRSYCPAEDQEFCSDCANISAEIIETFHSDNVFDIERGVL